jgi:pimeloyl-ACP methyl ester carboxylesterase
MLRSGTFAPWAPLLVSGLAFGAIGCGSDDAPSPIQTPDASSVSAGDAGAAPIAMNDSGIRTIDNVPPLSLDVALPIVFVHGYAGSAQQLISNAMRFEANGYPVGRIRAYEHNGGQSTEDFPAGVDKVVDATLAEFKVPKVYLIGHSRGTQVSSTYLGDPARAAKIAKYISLDGFGCTAAIAANVPCIEPNQASLPGQSHVEVATSVESFAKQYEFLIGSAPKVTAIVKQTEPVVISGRAVNFPENTGRAGVTLEIWEIDAQKGSRVGDKALSSFQIGDDGNWGPVTVDPSKHYEMVLLPMGGTGNQHHHYMQPFLRSTPFVRLLSGPPDTESRKQTNSGPGHSAAVASRMREWQTTDKLEISTTTPTGSQPATNVIIEGVGVDPTGGSDIASLVRGRIGIHLHDDKATPMMTTLAPLPWFSTQPFQTGVDLYMPASDPPNGTITFKSIPRGNAAKPQILNTPNWASTNHLISLLFADYAQD